MVGSFLMLGLALTSSNYVINESNSQVYDITYQFTMDNIFLTHDDEFNLELYDILGLNAFEVSLGQVVYETSSWQDFEYYYNTSIQIIDTNNEYLYTYSNSMYVDSYSAQQWLYINIGGQAYIDTMYIENYLNATFRLNFRFYCSGADTLTKTPLKSDYNAKAFHFDSQGIYNTGYRKGFEEGSANGYSEGLNDSSSLYQMVVAIPDRFIQSFHTIFSFEVFGVNVFNFIVSIISIGLIIWLVKKVSGS